jgi:CHAT domain-containing protein
MYRGVLLLAGGERTRKAWEDGAVLLPFSDDGILTAEEAAGLDLSGTWLTVLSACRSGSGDARIGEGVLGLRRAFALAGSEQLLFSLWSVDDDATAEFMNGFYERLFAGKDPRKAFNETQAEELRRWRRIEDVESAVFRAGAFILSR